jgi:hypothetical protein
LQDFIKTLKEDVDKFKEKLQQEKEQLGKQA